MRDGGWRETIAIQNDVEFLNEIKQGLATLKKTRQRCIRWKNFLKHSP